MLQGRNKEHTFRSKGARGEWVLAGSITAGITLGNQQTVSIPKNLPGDFKQRGWLGQVPAMAIRARGTITPDTGVQDLYATKHQILSHLDVMIHNDYKQPYMQVRESLTAMAYYGMLVNPDAELLDQNFVDDGERPLRGIVPANFVSPDVGIAANDAKPVLTQNGSNYPATDVRDSYWRQLEGRTLIATAVPVASTFDFVQSMPLCAGTGSVLKDSIPLDTICDLNKPWTVSLRMVRDPNTTLHKDGGSGIQFTRLDVYLYVIVIRDTDPRVHGLPYVIRHKNRATSPLPYEKGEVVLFSGNLPLIGVPNITDTVNGKVYTICVAHGDYKQDMTAGNVLEWATSGEVSRFPYWFMDRSPRHVYESIHNARPRHHLVRYGSSSDIVVRSARAITNLGFVPTADSANLTTLLGTISPWPCRILAETALEVDGFPGFGTLDASCGTPYIDANGSYSFAGTNSSIDGPQGMVDIVLNNSSADKTYIEDLGRGCCRDGTVVFAPTAANPDSPKADIVAGKITPSEEMKPEDAAKMKAAGMAPAGDAMSNVAAAAAAGTIKQA